MTEEQIQETLDSIKKGALLHDVGKIAIPDAILKKNGPLTDMEWEKIKLHPSLGYGLIKEVKLVREVGNIILYHHERPDGFGYYGVDGDRIPRPARALAVAEVYDGMTRSKAVETLREEEAVERLESLKGISLDSDCVEALVDRLGVPARL